jgi:MFS family permease
MLGGGRALEHTERHELRTTDPQAHPSTDVVVTTAPTPVERAAGITLLTLAAGQFVMTLDSSVMNVSIATVAADVGTDITGIQTAITLYTLVMASLMITGGKVGAILGRKKAFLVGCVVYASGSLITALSQSLPMLLFGWSLLEGIGAALILPAIVALVASNFAPADRPRTYGLVAASGAIAVAAGPLIGGLATTYWSWRVVFVGEVLLVAGILVFSKRMADEPAVPGVKLDLVGTVLSAVGLGLVVFAVLRSGTWGVLRPKPGAPEWLGMSPVLWLLLAGATVIVGFFSWEDHLIQAGREPLLDPSIFRFGGLRAGLGSFFFQYLLQAGIFFVVPLFLSVALGLTPIATGVRILPLSVALLAAAVGVPRVLPNGSPRRIVQVGLALILLGVLSMIGGLEVGADASIVSVPLLLIGLGIGALASQLGAVTVSAVPDEQSAEVGGLQNTVTNLGASIGTAFAGAVLISALASSFLVGIQDNPDVPDEVVAQTEVQIASGAPFLSDADLDAALSAAGVDADVAESILDENASARIDGLRAALGALAVLGVLAILAARRLPSAPVGQPATPSGPDPARSA